MSLISKFYLVGAVLFASTFVSCQTPNGQANQYSGPTLLYADDFSAGTSWLNSTTASRAFYYYSGVYQISTSSEGTWWWASCPYSDKVALNGPYIIEFSGVFSVIDKASNGAFGLVFNYIDDNNYDRLSFDAFGKYSINRIFGGKSPSPPIVDWTPCPSFLLGEINTVRVVDSSTGLEVLVNGTKIVTTSAFPIPNTSIKVGLMIDNFGYSTSKANFSKFSIYKP